jgi:hypothetical protein
VIDQAALRILVSGLVHAIVNAILKAGKNKLSDRALIDGFSALLIAPAALWAGVIIGSAAMEWEPDMLQECICRMSVRPDGVTYS